MTGIILRKAGVALLTILKVVLHAAFMMVNMFFWCLKLLLGLFGLIVRIVVIFVRVFI